MVETGLSCQISQQRAIFMSVDLLLAVLANVSVISARQSSALSMQSSSLSIQVRTILSLTSASPCYVDLYRAFELVTVLMARTNANITLVRFLIPPIQVSKDRIDITAKQALRLFDS